MKKMSDTIVFFGSGPVAAQSLRLLANNFHIEAVVTKPKPKHHKAAFPVIDTSEYLGLPIIFANNKQELSDVISQHHLNSPVGILVDFGIILARSVIDAFPLGIINSHFSLLPEWRGADPITFSILSGQKRTGVSLMLLVEKMDEGPILALGVQEITPTMTAPELTQSLILLSDSLLAHELPRYIAGDSKPISQERLSEQLLDYPSKPSYSRKITKDDGIIDWHKSAEQLEREIRAYIEWPKSRATLGAQEVIITKAHIISGTGTPGTRLQNTKELGFYTAKDVLIVDRLKPAGKNEMSAEAFMAGYGNKL